MSSRLPIGPEDGDDGLLAVEVLCGERLMLRDNATGEWSFPMNDRPHSNRYAEFVEKWRTNEHFRNTMVQKTANVLFSTKNGDDEGSRARLKRTMPCAAMVYVYGPRVARLYWNEFVPIYLTVRRIRGKYA